MDIQVGDKITYKFKLSGKTEVALLLAEADVNGIQKDIDNNNIEVLKIERPKYEVVEEKKELLTEEEKEFLRQALKFGNYGSDTGNGTIKFIVKSGYFIELYYEDWTCNTIYIDKKLHFKNLEQEEQYTLKELGLEEK